MVNILPPLVDLNKMFASGLPTPEEATVDVAGTGAAGVFPQFSQGGGQGQGPGPQLPGGQRNYWTPNAIGAEGGGAVAPPGVGSGHEQDHYGHMATYGQGYPSGASLRVYDHAGPSSGRMEDRSSSSSAGIQHGQMTVTASYDNSSYNTNNHQTQHQHHRSDSTHRSLAPFSTLESSSAASASASSSTSYLPRISEIGPPPLDSPYQPTGNFPSHSYESHSQHGSMTSGMSGPSGTTGNGHGGDVGGAGGGGSGGGLPSMFSMLPSPDHAMPLHQPASPFPMIDPSLMRQPPAGGYAYPVPIPFGGQPGYMDMYGHPLPHGPDPRGTYGRYPTQGSAPGSERGPGSQPGFTDGQVIGYAPSDGGHATSSSVSHLSFLDRQQQPPLLSPQGTGPPGQGHHGGYPMYPPSGPGPGSKGYNGGQPSTISQRGPQQKGYQQPQRQPSKRKRGYSTNEPTGQGGVRGEGPGLIRSPAGRKEDEVGPDGFRRMRGGSKPPQDKAPTSPFFSSMKPKYQDTGVPRLNALLSDPAPPPERPVISIDTRQVPAGFILGPATSEGNYGPPVPPSSSRRSLNVTQVTGSYAVPQRSRDQETARLLATLRDSLPNIRTTTTPHYLPSIEAVQNELAGLQANLREGLAVLIANTSPNVWTQTESGPMTLQSMQTLVNSSRAVLDAMTSHSVREPSEPWRSPYSGDAASVSQTPLAPPPPMLFHYSPESAISQPRYPGFPQPEEPPREESLQSEALNLAPLASMDIDSEARPSDSMVQEVSYVSPPVPMLDPAPMSRVPPPVWQKMQSVDPVAINPEALVQPKQEDGSASDQLATPVPPPAKPTAASKRDSSRPKLKEARSSESSIKPPGPSTNGSSKPKRVSHSPWTPEEAVKLAGLAEASKGKIPGLDPNEVDWDYVVNGFKGTRSRHQVLIKAVYLGVKPTTTHASRLVRQKQYKGKESELGLSPDKIKRYLSLGGKGDDSGEMSSGE